MTFTPVEALAGQLQREQINRALAEADAVWVAAPASATAPGAAGELAYDSGFIYVCTAANTWRRVAVASW
jgi:hypothetical protein